MVKTGQTSIRQVRFLPPAPDVGDIEVNTLRGIRDRGGPREFLTPQRLDFDLLFGIESGTATHTVDFTEYPLHVGDLLWVRAGQVHQWGAIDDIEGPVVMFGPHTVDERTQAMVRKARVRPRVHWTSVELEGTPVARAIDLMVECGDLVTTTDVRRSVLGQSLAALLLLLTFLDDHEEAGAGEATPEAFIWFRDHIEERFREWHQVSDYADRLGYSARTLSRLTRQQTGLSAKELIDERILLEAKRQLSHSDAPVAEIAEELGFDDASNFSSYFRRQAKVTPGAFRTWSRGRSLQVDD
jgi:AraC-like DNA-binding protein